MGSGQSSRRRRQQHQHLPPPPPPPPPGYHTNQVPPSMSPCSHVSPYYYHHQQHQQYYPPPSFITPAQGFIQQQYGSVLPPPPLTLPPPPPPALPALPPPPPPLVPESQKANTVRNDVNLNKATLRLDKDDSSPGQHVVAFSFDATSAGSTTVFFLAREAPDGSLASVSTIFPPPSRTRFKSGLGQKFKQEEPGLDYSLIDEEDLSSPGPDNVYPLVIRIETVPKDASHLEEAPGGPLRKWFNCQQTYAVIQKKDEGEFQVKVVKQIIWVDGVRYELQEIYGIASGEVNNSSESGKECVICLSEPKDTTVLPCRHMCMCSDCANVLRYQSNLCPICRCPVEELIQIKVSPSE